MKIDRRVVLGILLAGLLFFTGILLRDFLLANFVKPIALLLWAGNRLISSINQSAYWAGLILVLLLISLLRFSWQPAIYETDKPGNENDSLYSVRQWRTLILLTSDEADRLNFLKNSLRTLLTDIYAARSPSQAPWKIYEDFAQGDIRLPVSIREFLMLDPSAKARPTVIQRLQHLSQAPARLVRHWTKQDRAEYYQSIAEVISFLEKQLENEDEQ
jgi:hypothetical protein